MTSKEYIQTIINRKTTNYSAVLARLSNKAVQGELKGLLKNLIQDGHKLDMLKKHLMYGKEKELHGLTQTKEIKPSDAAQFVDVLHSIIGTITESVEQGEILLKLLKDPNGLDVVNFKEELGDSCWYAGLGINALGSTFEDIWKINDDKLTERMGGKNFSAEGALNRDVEAEKKVMEDSIKEVEQPKSQGRVLSQHNGTYKIDIPDSSQIKKMEYANNILTVYFAGKDGKLTAYDYQNVPLNMVMDLMFGESIGKLFAANIKAHPEQYPFSKKD